MCAIFKKYYFILRIKTLLIQIISSASTDRVAENPLDPNMERESAVCVVPFQPAPAMNVGIYTLGDDGQRNSNHLPYHGMVFYISWPTLRYKIHLIWQWSQLQFIFCLPKGDSMSIRQQRSLWLCGKVDCLCLVLVQRDRVYLNPLRSE